MQIVDIWHTLRAIMYSAFNAAPLVFDKNMQTTFFSFFLWFPPSRAVADTRLCSAALLIALDPFIRFDAYHERCSRAGRLVLGYREVPEDGEDAADTAHYRFDPLL